MKSIVNNDNKTPSKPFPKLMIGEFHIVLFSSPNVGTCINSINPASPHRPGYHSYEWNSTAFKDFEGSVTLSND